MFRAAGFEGFFTSYDEDTKRCRELADELGMEYQSVHAPTKNMGKVWDECEEGDEIVLTKSSGGNKNNHLRKRVCRGKSADCCRSYLRWQGMA